MIYLGVVTLILDVIFQNVFRSKNLGFENRGVSFGMAASWGDLLAILALVMFVVWLVVDVVKNKRVKPFLFLITLGGVGNFLERVVNGSVWDYICLPLLPFCFNLSDVLISLGVVSYILGVDGNRRSLRRQRHTDNQ